MQPAADLKRRLRVRRKLAQQPQKKAGREEPSLLHLPNVADCPHSVSTSRLSWEPDLPCCHWASSDLSHEQLEVGWQLLVAQSSLAIHDDVFIRKGECPQLLRWVKEQWQGTSSGLGLWMLGEHQQGQFWTCGETSEWHHAHNPVHMPLSKPPSLPEEKNLFSPDQDRIPWHAFGHADSVRCSSSSIVHVPQSDVPFVEECHSRLLIARTSFGSGYVHLTRQRSFRMTPLHESWPNVFIFSWRKSPIQASTLLLASIKPPWKFKAFHKV